MTFNSFVFLGFFLAVYAGYLLLQGNLRGQNVLLLAASLVFYGYWDWRFLLLLLGTASVDYTIALLISGTEDARRRKLYLIVSLVSNLSVLGLFKYFNFFASSLEQILGVFGRVPTMALHIVLPVGISFYTFQAMGYTIDVYRRDTKAERNLLDFLLFISFFPQLVAGPIERASRLLPQVVSPRTIRLEQVEAALFLLLWGTFKKVVIADNCAIVANRVFNDYTRYEGMDVVLGVLAFTVQIYCDFSGYSDIARGLAKLLGFELMLNFKLPYLAQSPSDFWSRWHVSLSTWLRDYLYVPLGGNRKGERKTYRNLALTMLLGGLWHGAAWNYVLWGAYHGVLLILYRLFDRAPGGRRLGPRGMVRMLGMFVLLVVGWVLFRSRSVEQIAYMLTHAGVQRSAETGALAFTLLFFSAPLILVQIHQHLRGDLLSVPKVAAWVRVPAYAALLAGLCVFGVRESIEFIYFQF